MRPSGGGAAPRIKPMTLARGALAILVGLGVIGFIAIPSLRTTVLNGGAGLVDQVRRFIAPSIEIVHPIGAAGSSQSEGHEATKVIDTFTNTDWQALEDGPSVTLTFQEPIDLGAVFVHNGAATGFVDLRRPSRLRFAFPDGTVREIDLVDDHKPQQFTVEARSIDRVVVTVLGTNGPAGAPVALSEIEFFRSR